MAYWDLIGPDLQFINGTETDDIVQGSIWDGASMQTRMYGGNDLVDVYAGYENFVNGNKGNDKISILYTDDETNDVRGYGGLFMGGSGDDWLQVNGGSVYRVNGNKGNDLVVGLPGTWGEFRGGSNDDIIVVSNGIAYGDSGRDSFVMLPPNLGNPSEYAWVKDYALAEDTVYYNPNFGGLETFVSDEGLWLGQSGDWAMLLNGVYSTNQVNIIADSNIV